MKAGKQAVSDEDIIERLASEELASEGFRLLVEKFHGPLYWQIRRMVFHHEDAHDILQDCYLKIHLAIRNFKGKSSLRTWLYRIALNESLSFLERQQRRATRSVDPNQLSGALSERLSADPFFDGDSAQLLLQEAVSRLPDKQRAVFNLRYFEEIGYAEMAEILDTSEGALKASFHHAVRKITAFVSNR
ncbi:MAG: hypothetical protein RLY31_2969 [Bacteroidota bacterium]